jgi:hypothetical protein
LICLEQPAQRDRHVLDGVPQGNLPNGSLNEVLRSRRSSAPFPLEPSDRRKSPDGQALASDSMSPLRHYSTSRHVGGLLCCLSALAERSTVAFPGESRTTGTPTGGWRDVVTVSTRPVPGQAFGPYHIERLLGRGGMGDVYEAEHIEQGRRVALKVLNQRLSERDDRARFLREGQLAASINHPHTVYIFGSEEVDGIPTISMELLPGGTLKDRVKEHGPLPPSVAVDTILQAIAGLDAMHAVGVLHRDVKPSNCFADADGSVKVGDFGLSISTLARDVSQLTVTGAFLGTPQFAAPEQTQGRPVGCPCRHICGWRDALLPAHWTTAIRRQPCAGTRHTHRDRGAAIPTHPCAVTAARAFRDCLTLPCA